MALTPMKKSYQVAVFPSSRTDPPKFIAYLRVYNPNWPECCIHKIVAESAAEAKRTAINNHKSACIEAEDK